MMGRTIDRLLDLWRAMPAARRARLLAADLGLAVIATGYYSMAALTSVPAAHPLPASALDQAVDFSVWALLPYMSMFGMVALTYCRIAPAQVLRLLLTSWLCLGVSVVTYALWPTVVDQAFKAPALNDAVANWPWLRFICMTDTPANCLPSLHAALSVACAAAVQRSGQWRAACGWWAWTALIFWGAVSLRQHLSIDLAAGAVLALVMGAVSGPLVRHLPAPWVRRVENAVTSTTA